MVLLLSLVNYHYFLKIGLKPRFSLAGEISHNPQLHDLPLRSHRFSILCLQLLSHPYGEVNQAWIYGEGVGGVLSCALH